MEGGVQGSKLEPPGFILACVSSKWSNFQLLLRDNKSYSFTVRKKWQVPFPEDTEYISTCGKQLTIWIASAWAYVLIEICFSVYQAQLWERNIEMCMNHWLQILLPPLWYTCYMERSWSAKDHLQSRLEEVRESLICRMGWAGRITSQEACRWSVSAGAFQPLKSFKKCIPLSHNYKLLAPFERCYSPGGMKCRLCAGQIPLSITEPWYW